MNLLSKIATLALCAVSVAACGNPPVNNDVPNAPNDVADNDAAVAPTDVPSPMSEGGACVRGSVVTPYTNPETMCVGFTATPCPGDMSPFCPRFVDNNMMRPKFVLTQIDVQTPRTLAAATPVGRILNDAIRNGVFAWGVDINFMTNRVRTGTLAQPIMVRSGTGYYAEAFRFVNGGAPMPGMPNRWNPLDVAATISGETVSSEMTPLITIPVYDANMRANLLTELPLQNARIRDLRLTANRNCIGTAKFAGALGFNSCGPLNNNWNTSEGMTPAGVLEAVITVEDALRIQVVSLNMPLCTLIAGGSCTDAMGMPINPMSFTVPTNTMVNGKPGWTLTANISGVAANIAD